MKGGAHPSPFAALSFPSSKKKTPFTAVLTEFSSRRMAKPSLELTRYSDFLRYSRAAIAEYNVRLMHKYFRASLCVLVYLFVKNLSEVFPVFFLLQLLPKGKEKKDVMSVSA